MEHSGTSFSTSQAIDDKRSRQAIFRLPTDTYQEIHAFAEARGLSLSEVMRSAARLLQHSETMKANEKLAIVDTDDHYGPGHYKVLRWVINE